MINLRQEREFAPNKMQMLAKQKLYKFIEENDATVSINTLSVDRMSSIANAPRLSTWFKDENFVNWWFDNPTSKDIALAFKELAMNRIFEILTHPIESGKGARVTAKDIISTSKLVFELAGAFPKNENKIVFADKDISNLNEDELLAKISDMKKKLITSPKEGPKDAE